MEGRGRMSEADFTTLLDANRSKVTARAEPGRAEEIGASISDANSAARSPAAKPKDDLDIFCLVIFAILKARRRRLLPLHTGHAEGRAKGCRRGFPDRLPGGTPASGCSG
jgi:hypothetical protein